MKVLRHTLVSEGTTDAHLIPIIDWSLKQVGGVSLPEGTRAEFGRLLKKPAGLAERLATAIELYPCEVLFVHRDADKTNPANRIAEIREAVAFLEVQGKRVPAVAIIPVRMLEAWLCFDERAIWLEGRQPGLRPNGVDASVRLHLGIDFGRAAGEQRERRDSERQDGERGSELRTTQDARGGQRSGSSPLRESAA